MTNVTLRDLTRRFDQLIRQVESVDVRVPEDSALISLATDLVPKVTRQLRDGIALLTDVETLYAPTGSGAAEAESLTQIGLQISAEFATRDLCDVAFFARTELRTALEHLVTAATRDPGPMVLASSCEAGLRRVRKALVSVESAVFEFEGMPPPERQWFDVEVSLQIRKLYWNLRRETGGGTDAGDDSLEPRLRAVLYRIVAFRELSVYPFLRVDDRVHLRRLLKRILEWLNGETRDPLVARRLWQDLSGFAEILVQVSHRQELRDHDLALITRTQRTLFPRGSVVAEAPERLLDELQSVLGLDTELDRLILRRDPQDVEVWRQPLRRLHAALTHTSDLHAPPELWPG